MFGVLVQSVIILLLSVLTILYFFFRYNYGYWRNRGVPYAEPAMFFGNLSFFMRKSFHDAFYELSRKYRCGYLGIFLSWKPTLMIQSKELARQILVKDSAYFQDRHSYSGSVDDPLGSLNLFTLKGPTWNQMRGELSPMFTCMHLKGFTELMNLNSSELMHRIQKDFVEKKEPVDLKKLFLMYSSDTVAYTVFGIRVSTLKELTSPLWIITQHMVKWTFWRAFEFIMVLFLPAIAAVLRLKLFSQPASMYVKKLFWDIANERKRTGETNDRDLVNRLLKLKANLKLPTDAGTELADNLMLAQAAVFILAAIETTSSTLTYCLHELAHNPDKQEKLYEEVSEALKMSGKDILEYNDLLKLKYLTGCVLETLRKYPPVPHLDRLCSKPYKLTDELTLESGTPILVNVMAIHHNEEYYPDPEKWLPERFIDMSDGDNRNFTFLPFGEGPRFCIGKRFGILQIRAAIAQMVTKYRFETDEPYIVKNDPYSVVLAPLNGGRVIFIPRE